MRPEEDVEVAVSSFFSKINTPVLSGLSLDYGNIDVYDRFPGELPDLFQGSQVIVMGRYRNSGQTTIRLSGFVNNSEQNFDMDTEFPQENLENYFLPRLWATRKVGYLLDQIRLEGENQEVIDEIVALSKKYGIITPYTSFLITEETPAVDNWAGLAEQVGALAFDNAVNNAKYREAGNMQQTRSEQVRYIGDKTFFLRDGFWVDSRLEEQGEIVDVEFASDSYFELLSGNRDLGRYVALGKNVLLNFNDTNYRIHESGKSYTVLPENLTLFQNYPNPFNSRTTITFELREPAVTSIYVYDLSGREVCTLLNRHLPEGSHRIQWNGTDNDGVRVTSGVYFCKIKAGYLTGTKKMLLIQ